MTVVDAAPEVHTGVLVQPTGIPERGHVGPPTPGDPAGERGAVYAWALVAISVVVGVAAATGIVGTAVTGPVIGLCTIAIAIGLRINRPVLGWPFKGFVAAGIFWLVAGACRELLPASSGLGGTSVWADAIALPGYAVYGICLVGLTRARDGRNRGAVTDAIIVSVGGFLLAWQFLIARTLDTTGVTTIERVAIISFIVIDCGFVALACRLAFASSNRLTVHVLVLAAMCGMFVSDVLGTIDALGIVSIGERQELGYLWAAAAMGAAGLHPSIRFAHVHAPVRRGALPMGRATLLALSLMLPTAQVALITDHRAVSALPYQIGVVTLAVVATIRLLDSVRNQNAATEALSWQATHDSLTQLPNRNAITAHLDERLRDAAQPDLVAYFDLDRFKNVNDALGHAFGDQLLIAVSKRLRGRLPSSVLLGRIGGDEFVAVAPLGMFDPDELAAHIQSALGHPFVLDGSAVSTSVSIGITSTAGCADAHAVLRDADTAMYRAKAGGRDTYLVFADDMRVQVERRMEIERLLRQALDRGGELTAWFQPVVDVRTGVIEGFEALARWIRPDGMIPPSEFIGVAEESGLISRVGAIVLDEACAGLAAARRRSGRDLFVSVNVSVRQLADDTIVDMVADTLRRHELPGSALCLEITESIMMNDQNIERLHALRRLGVWLAVDDFGTGYSSLSYLRQMPVSKVKIDKSFVDDIEFGDTSILKAILSMAHSLGLACIAEGVETEGQGYLWSQPTPVGSAIACLAPVAVR